MILNYYGENLTTNQVFSLTGAGTGMINVSQMTTAVKALGYKSAFITNSNTSALKVFLDKNIPVICLVHYGSLNSTQDKKFKGGHFFCVVGYRDDGYFVNDPNFKGDYRADGDHHFYTKEEFEKSWNDCSLDGNPINSMIIIYPKDKPTETQNYSITKGLYDFLLSKSQDTSAWEGMVRAWYGSHQDLINVTQNYEQKIKELEVAYKNSDAALVAMLGEKHDWAGKADRYERILYGISQYIRENGQEIPSNSDLDVLLSALQLVNRGEDFKELTDTIKKVMQLNVVSPETISEKYLIIKEKANLSEGLSNKLTRCELKLKASKRPSLFTTMIKYTTGLILKVKQIIWPRKK